MSRLLEDGRLRRWNNDEIFEWYCDYTRVKHEGRAIPKAEASKCTFTTKLNGTGNEFGINFHKTCSMAESDPTLIKRFITGDGFIQAS